MVEIFVGFIPHTPELKSWDRVYIIPHFFQSVHYLVSLFITTYFSQVDNIRSFFSYILNIGLYFGIFAKVFRVSAEEKSSPRPHSSEKFGLMIESHADIHLQNMSIVVLYLRSIHVQSITYDFDNINFFVSQEQFEKSSFSLYFLYILYSVF